MVTVAFGCTGGISKESMEDVGTSIIDGLLDTVARREELREVSKCLEVEGDIRSFVTNDCLPVAATPDVIPFASEATEGTEYMDVVIDSLIPAVFSANDFVTLCVVRPLIPRGTDSIVVVKYGVAGVTLIAGNVGVYETVESGTCLDKNEILVMFLLVDVTGVDTTGIKNVPSSVSVWLTTDVSGAPNVYNEGDVDSDTGSEVLDVSILEVVNTCFVVGKSVFDFSV